MVTRKQIWDKLDEWEGKKKGSSYKALQKELKLQGLTKKVPKEEKIKFLMKSNLYDVKKLMEMDKKDLDTLFKSGLEATGFKPR